MSNIDYRKMEDAFERALKSWSRGGNSFGGGGSSPSSPSSPSAPSGQSTSLMDKAVTQLSTEITKTGGALGSTFLDLSGKLVKGGARVSDVTGSLANNFQAAGAAGSTLSKALGGAGVALDEVVKYVEEGIDVFRDLSTSGAAFNNSVIEMRVSAANTRMTLDDYADVIRNNSKTLAGLGASVHSGVKVFNEFSKAFFDNSELNDRLRNMGYTTKDLNELLALNLSINRVTGKLSREAMDAQIESAAALATEMDAVAKLTGKSRKEQEDALRKLQENGQVRASIELAVAKGGEGVRKAFSQMSVASEIGGASFKRMQEEIFAMGRPSKEMAQQFAMAGGAAQKLMFDAAAAAKRGDEAEAKRLTQEAAVAFSLQTRNKAMLSVASQGLEGAVKNVESAMKLADTMESVAKQNNLNLNLERDRSKALELAKKVIADEQKNVEGATKSVIAAEGRMADAAAAVNNLFVDKINKAVNPALTDFAKYLGDANTGLGRLRERVEKPFEDKLTQDRAAQQNTSALNAAMARGMSESRQNLKDPAVEAAFRDLNKVLSQGGAAQERAVAKLEEMAKAQGQTKEQFITEVSKRADPAELKRLAAEIDVIRRSTREGVAAPTAAQGSREQAGQGRTLGEMGTDAITSAYSSFILGLEKLFTTGGGAKVEVTNLPNSINPEPRSGGTYGAGLDTEKVGSILKITSPGEVVLNAKQQKELATGLIDKGAEKAVEGLRNAVKPSAATGSIDLSTIKNDIKTTFSSLTSRTSAPSAAVERSIDFGKIGLSDQQKKVFDEMMSMTSEESKKRLESLKLEQQAAANTNKEVLAARDAIEERYEREGKLSELESNEEYKRLTEQLNASFKLSKEKKAEVDAAVQAENTRSNIVKLYGKSLDELKGVQNKVSEELVSSQKSAAEEIAKASELTKTSIVGSVPVTEVKQTASDLTAGLTGLQKDFFNVLIEQDQEALKLKEGGYKKQLEADINGIREADKQIAEVKSQLENATTDVEKRRLGHRLSSLEKEKSAYEDSMQFTEENLEVVERAIAAKKGEIKATEETIAATKEKAALETNANTLKAAEDIKNELPVPAKTPETVLTGGVPVTEEQIQSAATLQEHPAVDSQTIENTERQRRAEAQAILKGKEQPKVEPPVAAPKDQSDAETARLKRQNTEAFKSSIVTKDGKINLNNVFGLGGFGQELKAKPKEPPAAAGDVKPAASQMTTEVKNDNKAKEEQARRETQTQTTAKPAAPAQTSAAPQASAGKNPATLDDVVVSLNRLNTQMSQLIKQQDELLTRQIRTTKASASNSVYDRMAT